MARQYRLQDLLRNFSGQGLIICHDSQIPPDEIIVLCIMANADPRAFCPEIGAAPKVMINGSFCRGTNIVNATSVPPISALSAVLSGRRGRYGANGWSCRRTKCSDARYCSAPIRLPNLTNPVCTRPRDQFVARLAQVRCCGLSPILLTPVGTGR